MDLFRRQHRANLVKWNPGVCAAEEILADPADRDPELRIMELEAEVRNVRAEVWWLRVAVVGLGVALAWVGISGLWRA
jgi:hypothetical protein